MAVEPVTVDCPFEGCPRSLVAEINADFENMSEAEKTDLLDRAHKRLEKAITKHHQDGHPKETE